MIVTYCHCHYKGGFIRLSQCTNYWYPLYVNRVISQLTGSYVRPQQYCSYFAQSNATLVRQSCEPSKTKTVKYSIIYCVLVQQSKTTIAPIIFFKQIFFCSSIYAPSVLLFVSHSHTMIKADAIFFFFLFHWTTNLFPNMLKFSIYW